ncbi:hypothetical protein SmJEL517_g03342 [Synchytrium microbalum]|uniref:Major facilitator superfamily (MFS) profile domain-containing protein n=1 Tax=Synchytrium microbalum TaxID=1806994 RepID=A0A507C404_9FUNG|nr:uncharacterized protein SmJEL517_g03342 [Synchytrium microbalum]TPX33819.1 hypothetical protein SmJEL517_g03342 [Synchytrium microbalum]
MDMGLPKEGTMDSDTSPARSVTQLLKETGAVSNEQPVQSSPQSTNSTPSSESLKLPTSLSRRSRRNSAAKLDVPTPGDEDGVKIQELDEVSCASVFVADVKETTDGDDVGSGRMSMASLDSSDPRMLKLNDWKYSRFTEFQKWSTLVLISSAAVLVPLSTNIYYPALITIQQEFNTTATMVNLTVTCYILLIGWGPILWSIIADSKGRKITYILSLFIFFITSIATSFSTSIEMLLVLRVAQAIGGSSVLAVGAGTISDLFAPHERGTAMGWYILGPQIGPLAGPLIGGAFTQYLGWRSIFYFLSAYSLIVLLGMVFLMDETLVPTWYDPERDPKITTLYLLRSSGSKLSNPLDTFKFLRYPPISLMILNSCIIYMIAYCLATSLTRDYQIKYGFNPFQAGLAYIPMTIGNLLGTVFAGKLSDRVMEGARVKLAENLKQDRTASVPEARLKGSLLTSWTVPIGLLLHGWTIALGAPFYAPMFGQFIFGAGQMAPFVIGNTYLVDCFAGHSSSIMALNNALRSLAGSMSALFVTPLESALGPQGTGYLFTLLSVTFLFAYAIVFYVWRYGEQSRLQYHRWNHHLDAKSGSSSPKSTTAGVMYYGPGMEGTRERVRRGSVAEM